MKRDLPKTFMEELRRQEASYLRSADPMLQSGYGGGDARWRVERGVILEAVADDGDFLDVGCANGHLLECLVAWAKERGIRLTPFGLDFGADLVELARERLPDYAANFWVGNAWEWTPPRRFDYVYTLYDCVPRKFLGEYVSRLLARCVAPSGRLVIGAYSSRSKNELPLEVGAVLSEMGYEVEGVASAGEPVTTRLAWVCSMG